MTKTNGESSEELAKSIGFVFKEHACIDCNDQGQYFETVWFEITKHFNTKKQAITFIKKLKRKIKDNG